MSRGVLIWSNLRGNLMSEVTFLKFERDVLRCAKNRARKTEFLHSFLDNTAHEGLSSSWSEFSTDVRV
jgi:hypothetical protein